MLFQYFYGKNLILKGMMEPSEPERGAEAHEVRRSAEFFLQKGNEKIELLPRPGPDDFFKHGWYDTASHRGFEETDSTGGKVDLSSEGGHF